MAMKREPINGVTLMGLPISFLRRKSRLALVGFFSELPEFYVVAGSDTNHVENAGKGGAYSVYGARRNL
jgi:hypothetical protein